MRTHKRGDDYDTYKEKFAQKLLEVLYDKVSLGRRLSEYRIPPYSAVCTYIRNPIVNEVDGLLWHIFFEITEII